MVVYADGETVLREGAARLLANGWVELPAAASSRPTLSTTSTSSRSNDAPGASIPPSSVTVGSRDGVDARCNQVRSSPAASQPMPSAS